MSSGRFLCCSKRMLLIANNTGRIAQCQPRGSFVVRHSYCDIRSYVVPRGKIRVSTRSRWLRICFKITQTPVVIILRWRRGKPTQANPACNSPTREPSEGKSEYEPILRARTPGQDEPDLASGDARRRGYFRTHGGTPHCCSNANANAYANVSLGDYTVHQPGDCGGQLGLVQPWSCGRILAPRQ